MTATTSVHTRAGRLATMLFAALALSPATAQDAAPEADSPTIFHIVRMDLRDDADPEEIERVLGMMRELGDKLDVVESFVVGPVLAEGYDVGATYVLHGYHAFRTYMYDPLHLEIDRAGLPLVAGMESFDITDAPDKVVAAARISAIHRDRINDVPGLRELFDQMESYTGAGASD
jgi:hypothetical protein